MAEQRAPFTQIRSASALRCSLLQMIHYCFFSGYWEAIDVVSYYNAAMRMKGKALTTIEKSRRSRASMRSDPESSIESEGDSQHSEPQYDTESSGTNYSESERGIPQSILKVCN